MSAPAWEQVRTLQRPVGRRAAGAAERHSHAGAWEREEKGRQEGRKEGRQEGRQEGEAKALLRLLHAKFGPPSPDLATSVQAAAPDQIEVWLTRVLTANSLSEVFDLH